MSWIFEKMKTTLDIIKDSNEFSKEYLNEIKNKEFAKTPEEVKGLSPLSELEPEFLEVGHNIVPTSVGKDGYVYCRGWSNDLTIYRTNNGFDTVETGANLSDFDSGNDTILHVEKTFAGYVVVVRRRNEEPVDQSAVYFSENFDSGFQEILVTPIRFSEISIHFYNGGRFNSVGLLGEYSQEVDTPHKLYISLDGGQTWEETLETEIVDNTVNSHWHCAVYDPYTGRIYASQGDGDNRKMYFSDDLGEVWQVIDTPENDLGMDSLYQPTMLIATNKKIICYPDAVLPPVIFSLLKDEEFKEQGGEEFKLNWEHSIWDGVGTGSFFAHQPYAQKDGEIYFIAPSSSNINERNYYIVASGDGGQTWHTVYGIRLNKQPDTKLFNYGIVGDKENLYAYLRIDSTGYIFKAQKLKWR